MSSLVTHVHVFGQLANGRDSLFTRLETGAQKQADKVRNGRQGRRDDDVAVWHGCHRRQNKRGDPHHRRHDRTARRCRSLHAAGKDLGETRV